MNDMTIGGFGENSQTLTMSSREIAELLEARHDNVKRTMERLAERGLIRFTPSEETSHNGPGARPVEVYRVGKRDSYVVVAQLSPEFTARLVDRWQELEATASKPFDPASLSKMDILRLALESEEGRLIEQEKRIALEHKVEEDAPKTEFYDKFASADGLYGLQNAARVLNQPPNKFIGGLKSKYLFYQGGNLIPYRQYVERGLFEVKTDLIDDKPRSRTWVTPKGIQHFAKQLGTH